MTGHIEAMHSAWEAANIANERNDRANSRDYSPAASDAMTYTDRAARHLSEAILQTPPQTARDAMLLLLHAGLTADAVAESIDPGKETLAALNCALSSLFDWHLRQHPENAAAFAWSATASDVIKNRSAHLRGEV